MFDAIAPRYDLLNRILTLRMDVRWRRIAVEHLRLPERALVLDLACGTGDLCRELGRRGFVPIGIDLSAGMLAAATTSAPLVRGDVLRLPVRAGSADGVTCGLALRNFESVHAFFAAAAVALRPGGRLAIVEPSVPDSPLLAAGHRLYFNRVVPAVGGVFSQRRAYRYLPQSMGYLPDPAAMRELLGRAGFEDVCRLQLSFGIAQLYTASRC